MALNDSAELLAHIRLLGSIPSNAPDWSATTVLHQATKELLATHLPLLIAARGEYLVKTVDIPLVAGQQAYRLPARCCAVRMVEYLQADGSKTVLVDSGVADQEGQNITRRGRPTGYTFREHSLEVYPLPPSDGDSLRVRYHQRPSRIIPTSDAVVITSITVGPAGGVPAGLTEYTFVAPGTPVTWTAATRFDIVKPTSPFDIPNFDLLSYGGGATAKRFTTSEISADVAVGDYIVAANYSPFPNCLQELHEPIALRTAATIIRPKGDGLAATLVDQAVTKERQLLVGVLAPRSKGNPKTIRSRRWR